MTPELSQVLTELARSLGTTVPKLWDILLLQAQVTLWTNAVIYAAAVIGTITFVRWSKNNTIDDLIDCHTAFPFMVWMFSVVGICVLWIMSFVSVESTITALVSPELYAVKQILSTLK